LFALPKDSQQIRPSKSKGSFNYDRNKSEGMVTNKDIAAVSSDIFIQLASAKKKNKYGSGFSANHVFIYEVTDFGNKKYDIIEIRNADSVWVNVHEGNIYADIGKENAVGKIYGALRTQPELYKRLHDFFSRRYSSNGNAVLSKGQGNDIGRGISRYDDLDQKKHSLAINKSLDLASEFVYIAQECDTNTTFSKSRGLQPT